MAIKLQIPAPCHEKWSKMALISDDCRHCATCEHQVVDFSVKSDAEVLEYLRRNSGKVCGRFHVSQLNRPLLPRRPVRRGRLTAIAASFALTLTAQQAVDSQANKPVAVVQLSPNQREKPWPGQQRTPIRTISGKIIDAKTLEPVTNCVVSIKGTKYEDRTWANGIFSIEIPVSEITDIPLVLELKVFRFKKQRAVLSDKVRNQDIALMPIKYKKKPKKDEQAFFMGCPHF